MEQLSTLIASVALAAAAYLYVKVDRLERELGTARAVRVVQGADRAGDALPDAPRLERGDREGTARGGAGPAASSASEATLAADAPSIEERVAQLEQRQRVIETERTPPWQHGRRATARTMDELAQKLSLTPTQRARIEDAVARGRQRIEDVLKIPDETGKSPFERRAEARKKLEEAMKNPGSGGLFAFATDLVSYRQKKIPGRRDTYGDEIDRIRKETRDEIGSALDGQQQETFRDTNVDGLLGDAAQVSFAYSVGDEGGGGDAGMVVEMETTETAGTEEPAPGGTGEK
jgi:hypothetical protein